MTKEQTEKANAILEDIKELQKMKNVPKKHPFHFEMREHYGGNATTSHIPTEYNDRLLAMIDTFISELEKQLEDI